MYNVPFDVKGYWTCGSKKISSPDVEIDSGLRKTRRKSLFSYPGTLIFLQFSIHRHFFNPHTPLLNSIPLQIL